jgi:hypothetical protein
MHLRNVALITVLLWATAGAASAQVFQLGIEDQTIIGPDQSAPSQSNIPTDPVPANFDTGFHFFHRKHAIRTAESGLGIMPAGDARAHHDNAVRLADLGKIQEAIAEDELAVAANPNHPGYQILLGHMLTEGGQLERALTVYENACTRFPDIRDDISDCVLQLKALLSIARMEDTIDRVKAQGPIANGGGAPDAASATGPQTAVQPQHHDHQLTPRELADDRPIDEQLY